MLLIIIPAVWLGIAFVVLCLCWMAAIADREAARIGPRGSRRLELLVLEHAPAQTRARPRPQAHGAARRGRRLARPGALTTIHSAR
jgi:hypothetical protein